jgi:hypothetical protein
VKDDRAVVELHALATTKDGLRFDNKYRRVVYFDGDSIAPARAYLDAAMVAPFREEPELAIGPAGLSSASPAAAPGQHSPPTP